MRRFVTMAVLAGVAAGCGQAGVVERACNESERGGSRMMCGCIQQVADITLDRRDQKLAASFFDEPDKAQTVRQSDRVRDETFWRKYRAFGTSAESYCS